MTRIVIAALLVFSILLLFVGNKSSDHAPVIAKFESFILQSLSRDSDIISEYFASDNDRKILEKLDDSTFFIEVFRNDSITFWTDKTTINETNKNSYIALSRIGDSLNYADIRLQIKGDQQNIPSILLKDAKIDEKLLISSKEETKSQIKINENDIHLIVDDGHKATEGQGKNRKRKSNAAKKVC